MTEHTPSTGDIRTGFISWHYHSSGGFVKRDAAAAEFDRWLAQHDEEVRADELDIFQQHDRAKP